ncbi:MAG: hypothetical protein KIB51_13755 [Dysgonomonas mossii]|nr:hypothetical protein [Dysgonomonas mossii]
MFQIKYGKGNIPLNDIANAFYLRLNPKKKNGNFRKDALRRKILQKYKHETDLLKKAFYRELAKNRFLILKEIITEDPSTLQNYYNYFESKVAKKEIPEFYIKNGDIIESTEFGEEILSLFGYKSIRGGSKFIWLANSLDLSICPYCGYEYTLFTKNPDKILLDFDHFISKATAPYLSLSFYNLIPSCHNCNSTLKGVKEFTINSHIHPYMHDFHSLGKFITDRPVIQNDITSFDIKIDIITSNTAESVCMTNNISDFCIESRYNSFKNDVLDLDNLKDQYNETKKQEMLKCGILGVVFSDRIELLKYIAKSSRIPFDENEARKKTKGKFELDLAKEFLILDP